MKPHESHLNSMGLLRETNETERLTRATFFRRGFRFARLFRDLRIAIRRRFGNASNLVLGLRKVPITRSENMRRIRSRDSAPELIVRRALFRLGFRYRCAPKELPGRPDIVFRRKKVAIFVHGCFWHQHPACRRSGYPKSNVSYWAPKLSQNVSRDIQNVARLEALGYRVLTIWECELTLSRRDQAIQRVVRSIDDKEN